MILTRFTFDEWPELDRRLWASARTPTSILEDGGRAGAWRPATVNLRIRANSHWLKYLHDCGELSLDESPAARFTKPRITRYIAYLRTKWSDATISMHLHHLYCMVVALSGPAKEIAWLARLSRQILANAKSVHPKIARLADQRTLLNLGLH